MRRILFGLMAIVLLASCKPGDGSAGAKEMITRFGRTCSGSSGNWTNSALQQTDSLISVLEAIKTSQNADCKDLTSALSAANAVHQRLSAIANDGRLLRYREMEQRKLELIMAIDQAASAQQPDQGFIASLRTELQTTELQLLSARADYLANDRNNDRNQSLQALTDLTSYLQQLAGTGSLAACLGSSPAMQFGFAASVAALGGNFATPNLGANLNALGLLMASAVNTFRTYPIEQAKEELQGVEMQTALSCSFESMSNLYCDAQNTKRYIDFAWKHYENGSVTTGAWNGIDLLNRRYPVLQEWMQRIAEGYEASDSHGAARKNEPGAKRQIFESRKNFALAAVRESQKKVSRTNNPILIKQAENSAFQTVIKKLFMSSSPYAPDPTPNPFEEWGTWYKAVCVLSGHPECRASDYMSTDSSDNIVSKYPMQGGLQTFMVRLEELISEVKLSVDAENRESTINAMDIIASATIAPYGNNSPAEILEQLAQFSKDLAQDESRSSRRGAGRTITNAEESAKIFSDAAEAIYNRSLSADEALQVIQSVLQINGDTNFVDERVTNLVEWDFSGRVQRKELPDDISEDLRAGGISIVQLLSRAGVNGLNYVSEIPKIRDDIDNAHHTTTENLRISAKFFAPTIARIMKSIAKTAKETGETRWDQPSKKRLAQLCILTLTTVPKWPDDIEMKLCEGAKYHDNVPGSTLVLDFDQLREKIKAEGNVFENKVCTYYNFQRAKRLRLKPQPPVRAYSHDPVRLNTTSRIQWPLNLMDGFLFQR